MPFINVGNSRLHYEIQQGENPPVLMLCSTGMSARQWKRLRGVLSHRRCLALNYLGYAPSSQNTGVDWQVDYMAASTLLLQEAAPLDLVGHSYGGFLAMKLALDYPKHVRSLVLHEPVAWGSLSASQDSLLKESFARLYERLFLQGISKELWLEAFVDFWNQPGIWCSLSETRKNAWRELYPKIYTEVEGLCSDTTPLSTWQNVNVPVLITVGQDGPKHEQEVCRLLANTIPNCTLIIVEGGHLAPVTHHQSISLLYRDYLSR